MMLSLCSVLLAGMLHAATPSSPVKPPVVFMIDNQHALVEFATTVSMKDITISPAELLKNHTGEVSGRRLLLVFKAPLTKTVELTITGLTAVGSVKPLPSLTIAVFPPVWPISRKKLSFLWEDAGAANAYCTANNNITVAHLIGVNPLSTDDAGVLKINGGRVSVDALQSARALLECRQAHQITIAVTITPSTTPVTAVIMKIGDNLVLRRAGYQLIVDVPGDKVGTKITKVLGTTTTAEPEQVLISWDAVHLSCFVNGTAVAIVPTSTHSFTHWTGSGITLGVSDLGLKAAQGTLEGVAIFSRALTAEETAKNVAAYAVKLKARQPVRADSKQILIHAKLVAMTVTPTPEKVLPYKHALITHEYQVLDIVSGKKTDVEPGKHIRVARWGILAGKQTSLAELKIDDDCELTLELFSDHPELERQFTVDTLPEAYDLPYLLDVADQK